MTAYPVYKTLMRVIREQGHTCKQIAEAIGRDKVTFSQKCHGKVAWTLDEVYAVLGALKLPTAMMPTLFPPRNGGEMIERKEAPRTQADV